MPHPGLRRGSYRCSLCPPQMPDEHMEVEHQQRGAYAVRAIDLPPLFFGEDEGPVRAEQAAVGAVLRAAGLDITRAQSDTELTMYAMIIILNDNDREYLALIL